MLAANRFSAGVSQRSALCAPKILPWMARKAGLDDVQALQLWQRAAAESEKRHGCSAGSDFHAMAMSRFIDFLAAGG